MKLSKNFTLNEFVRSATAKRYKIDNTPSAIHIKRLTTLVLEVLQPARDHFETMYEDSYMKINSGYRCKKLSKKVGSSTRSFHYFGYAADVELWIKKDGIFIECNKELHDYIKDYLPFTELINEYNYSWVHVAYNPEDSRKMVKVIT